jgi:uncharacterized membrane protein
MYIEDESQLIPIDISRYGCYSSIFIMVGSIFAAINEYYVISLLAFVQSVVSYLNWSDVKRFSAIKAIDIIIACLILLRITWIDSRRFNKEDRRLWCITLVIILCVFVVNEILLYYQVKRRVYDVLKGVNVPQYFSLAYTKEGTSEREYAYYRSTITHICFIHIVPTIVVIYCIYKSCRV